jgi:cytochrome c peroxidase
LAQEKGGSFGRGKAQPLFTDFHCDNVGIPKNPENPFYAMPAAWNQAGAGFVDEGLDGYPIEKYKETALSGFVRCPKRMQKRLRIQ